MADIEQALAAVPPHHLRYATAWMLYQDSDLPPRAQETLQVEMDEAQEYFTYLEFQTFKATLPLFMEYWDAWALKVHEQRKELGTTENPPPPAD